MSLRQWQEECVDEALKKYKSSQHFLCLASPGAGKTVMAAELSKRLLDANEIDLVICFSPTLSVSESIRRTFSQHLGKRFDGLLGSVGASFTYHSLMFFEQNIWELFDTSRLLVIFDETHHCSGLSIEEANIWGQKILTHIQGKAAYTLALTGTPWRSDKTPIVMSHYQESSGHIRCDYIYGMTRAVSENVCRKPNIVLVDNEHVTVTSAEEMDQYYSSLREFLETEDAAYSALINHESAILYLLSTAHKKLQEIRAHNSSAAGLVVAASVEHAKLIVKLLKEKLNSTASIVSYRQVDAQNIIQDFRGSDVDCEC